MPKLTSISNSNQFLFALLIFFLPISVALSKIFAVSILILWGLSGDTKNKIVNLFANNFSRISLVFFASFCIGLIWTENKLDGLDMLLRMIEFLLLIPVLSTLVLKGNKIQYIKIFLYSIFLTTVFTTMIWLGFIPKFGAAQILHPSPFMSHISWGVFLAFGFYLAYSLFLNKNLSNNFRFFLIALMFLIIVNIFISEGRSGYIAFFVILGVIFFQKYGFKIKTFFSFLVLIMLIFTFLYSFSSVFKYRVNKTFYAFENIQSFDHSSLSQRIAYINNSLKIISRNPYFGVGTGEFKKEYIHFLEEKDSKDRPVSHPHNMYLLITTELGIFGLLVFLWYQISNIRYSYKQDIKERKSIMALAAMFIVLNFIDSYFLGHFTTYLFAVFIGLFANKTLNYE